MGNPVCLCGLPKPSHRAVCLVCWKELDWGVRADMRSINKQRRRSGVRKALEHAAKKNPGPRPEGRG